jgi:uncharacterized protein YukE
MNSVLWQASVVEAGEERDQALQRLESQQAQLEAVWQSEARLAAQVDSLTQELQSAHAALQHHKVHPPAP